MTINQELALMLDCAAAQTPNLALIPALCCLKKIALSRDDWQAEDPSLRAACQKVCRDALDDAHAQGLPCLLRDLLIRLFRIDEARDVTPEALRQRCCIRASQLRLFPTTLASFEAMWRQWPDRLHREERAALEAAIEMSEAEFERALMLYRGAIAARDIGARNEWLHIIEYRDQLLSGLSEKPSALERNRARVELLWKHVMALTDKKNSPSADIEC